MIASRENEYRLITLAEREAIPDTWVTAISVCPFPIPNELKPGLAVVLSMPKCEDWKNDFAMLPIKNAQYGKYIGNGDSIQIEVGPAEIGRSFINDWVTAQLCYSKNQDGALDAQPGLFLVGGRPDKETVKQLFAEELATARRLQTNWFIALVKSGDDNWKRTGTHRSITDKMRIACKELGLTRDWNIDPDSIDALKAKETKCPMCFTKVDVQAPICYNCKFTLDPAKVEALNAMYAKKIDPKREESLI